MMKKRKKIDFIALLILALVSFSCANQTILNSQPKPVPIPPAEQPKDSFERALRGVQSGNFTYIFVLRRKDGTELKEGDGRFIRNNSPAGTNQFVVTDDNLVVIIGSNFPFLPENLESISERFNIEDYSKPEAKQMNKNTNNSN